MTEQWEEEMERRQEARRQALNRGMEHQQSPLGRWASAAARAWMEGREAPPRTPVERGPLSEREQRLAAGLIFADRDDRQAAAQADDRARRRRADAEVTQRDQVWQALRDSEGIDYADQWMNGGDAA